MEMLISELSRGCGVPSTFVETNCFWCSCDRVVREKLELLKEKGLKGGLVYENPFYLEFVPFEYTERAVRVAQELFVNGASRCSSATGTAMFRSATYASTSGGTSFRRASSLS